VDTAREPTDAALVERFAAGDIAAFEALVGRYERPVFNFVRRLVGPDGEVEDLAQETFIRVYEKIRDLQQTQAFRSWLYSIAAHLCHDHFKRRRYRDHLPLADDLLDREPAPAATAAEQIERAEVGQQIEQAVRDLQPELRLVIVLREYQNLSYQEIAATVGCPVGTVRSRLFSGREELKKRLAFLLE
jgi:RNA polymerase sigma-70 factor (ECF subfamily)